MRIKIVAQISPTTVILIDDRPGLPSMTIIHEQYRYSDLLQIAIQYFWPQLSLNVFAGVGQAHLTSFVKYNQ